MASFSFIVDGGEATVEVHPLVSVGQYVVLTYDLRPKAMPDGASQLSVSRALFDDVTTRPVSGGAVRLVDIAGKRAFLPGVDADGRVVGVPGDLSVIPADGVRAQRVYATPGDVDSLGMLFPGHWVAALPVIGGTPPEPSLSGDAPAAPVDAAKVVTAPTVGVGQFTQMLDGAVQTIESTEQVQVSLGGDVLFASSSADLSPQAQSALQAAAAQLRGRAPGVVDVIGHTDDVGDDASNQALSEARAAAVAQALGGMVDTTAYQLHPSGRGESAPLVPNDTDAHRQQNRRVVLTLTSKVTTSTPVTSAGETPPFTAGPVATGKAGIDLSGPRPLHVTAPEAVRVGDDSLLVTIQVSATDTAVDSSFGVGGLNGVFSYRGLKTQMPQHALGVAVLSGATAVYPYDYKLPEQGGELEQWRSLADQNTLRRIDGGQTLTFVGLYPAIDGADTISVQVDEGLGADAFRLTDIPVVDASKS